MTSAVSNPGALTWSELISQPDAWQALLARLANGDGFPRIDLSTYDEVVLVGSGTSYYLAMAVGDWIKRRHDVPLRAVPSCEVMLDDYETRPRGGRRLAIGFSRSGESSELVLAIEALKRTGFEVLSIGCTENSSLLKLGDHVIHVSEGFEDGLVGGRGFGGRLRVAGQLNPDAVGLPGAVRRRRR